MIITTNLNENEKSNLFDIKLNGNESFARAIYVSALPYNAGWPGYQRPESQREPSAYLSYEADEPVTVTVTPNKDFKEVILRPISEGIKVERKGNTVSFTIPSCGQYSLEFDGHHSNLHIFADPVKDYSNEPRTRYYGAGVHNIGSVELMSNETVIIDRDARVVGGFFAVEAENIKICGYGCIDGSWEHRTNDTLLLAVDVPDRNRLPRDRENFLKFAERTSLMVGAIKLYNCKNCTVEGVTCIDQETWTISCYDCVGLRFDNVKLVGEWKYNTDGIDIMNSHDVIIENSFLRNFDDCVVLKGIQGWDEHNVYDIVCRNLVVWCDWGRALEIGAETTCDEYYNIVFDDCDVIHSAFSCCDIQNGDKAYVHDLTFKNINYEVTKYQQKPLFQSDMNAEYVDPVTDPMCIVFIQGYTGQWSNLGIPGKTDRIYFENLNYYTDGGEEKPIVWIKGYDANHLSSDIVIDGISENGKRLSPDEVTLRTNEFVKNVTIR